MADLYFNGSLRPLNEEILAEFQKRANITLPDSYRAFLFKHNGGIPHMHMVSGIFVQCFYGVTLLEDSLSILNAMKWVSLPPGVIPIASLGDGGELCLELQTGRILAQLREDEYSEPSKPSELTVVATDIDELTKNFEGRSRPYRPIHIFTSLAPGETQAYWTSI